MNVHWWPRAADRLLAMPRAEAERVDLAVQRWATKRQGVYIAGGEGAYMLAVGGYVVIVYVDDMVSPPTVNVADVRPARRSGK